MKNKQKGILKFLLAFSLALVVANSHAQNAQLLSTADSLFQKKQFTQSLEIYEGLFDQHIYSEAMLLRMAFIEEGLGHVSASLYYLNLYYTATGDARVLEKIQQVANKYKLRGYEHSEMRVVQYVIDHYQTEVNLAVAAVLILLLALLFYFKQKTGRKPFAIGFGILIFSAMLFSNLNFDYRSVQGIVRQNGTYLMSGPSSGSSVVGIISEGNMVPINHKQDVWVQVTWNGQKAYVKESQLLKVQI